MLPKPFRSGASGHSLPWLPGVLVSLASLLGSQSPAQSLDDPFLRVGTYASGFSSPTTLGFLGPDDLLVLQKNDGKVFHVVAGTPFPTPALDVDVNTASERGLLGIAVNTENPPKVFLYYTLDDPNQPNPPGEPDSGTDADALANRVYRYTWNQALGVLEDPQLILDLPVFSGPNHDGGIVVLGPTPTPGGTPLAGDGSLLYVVIGDLNRDNQLQNDPTGSPPDDTSVILRVQQDGSPAPGNPFNPYCRDAVATVCSSDAGCPNPGPGACVTQVARYFAYGIRNSFGMALDPSTLHLWDTENGPGDYDEVNLVQPGFNSGWNRIMGPDSRDPQDTDDLFDMPGSASTYSDPELSWLQTIAPTSILFPVGSVLGPAYDGAALLGDVNTGQLYKLPLNGPRTAFDLSAFPALQDLVADEFDGSERDLLRIGSGFGAITDLEVGPDGAVYLVSLSNGSIYRISSTVTPSATPTRTVTATATMTRTPTVTATFSPGFTPPSATPSFTPTRSATIPAGSTVTSTPTPAAESLPSSTPGAALTSSLLVLLAALLLGSAHRRNGLARPGPRRA